MIADPTSPDRWLIVADDVTGALDSAVGFAGTGRVEYGIHRAPDADVVAVSTGSRALPEPPVELALGVGADRFDRVFVKIDSTLRGHPSEHTRAVLRWWRPGSTAIVCPAAPELGRTVRDGRVLVDGVPAARSAAGTDPVAPVSTDLLPELFDAPVVDAASIGTAVGRVPAVVVDATSSTDLAIIAAAVEAAGAAAVPVGSAGLARALGDLRPRVAVPLPGADEVVVVATSVHPATRAQLAAIAGHGAVLVPPPLHDAVVPHDAAADAARAVAIAAAERVAGRSVAVVVVGGDGTDALLTELGATGVDVLGSALPGVPWGRIRGGSADGTLIATKSGGFGRPDTLAELIRLLTEDSA